MTGRSRQTPQVLGALVDGTAAFYNYIYYTVAGFTENDAFRSNQIRAGVLNRSEAARLVELRKSSALGFAPRLPRHDWCGTRFRDKGYRACSKIIRS